MTKHIIYIPAILLLFLFSGCKSSIKPEDLYGKWKYTKIEHANADPPEMPAAQLQSESPSIEFSKDNSYVIMWGGKALSHGTFTTDGMNIRIKENLPDGTTRAFPFWVSELTDKEIVFATLGQDGSKVTAVRE
jgi:hypothetical protein